MRYIVNHSTSPYYNLAMEAYCLENIDVGEDYFLLWQNRPSIIVGKNQCTQQEVNANFVADRSISVARRISGGGAVYHDFGNLNFTFISRVDNFDEVDYKRYVAPVIEALGEMGVHAEVSGRNDVAIDGKKISGNAQRIFKNRIMHHGTLLFDVNLDDLVQALNVSPDKIVSKGIQSVRSRVTNIKPFLPQHETLESFKHHLTERFSNGFQSEEIKLTERDLMTVRRMEQDQFSTWDWIYGNSPEFSLKSSARFPGGKIEIQLESEDGKISDIFIQGDFLSVLDVTTLEKKLIGVKFDRDAVYERLKSCPIALYLGSISLDDFINVLFDVA
jgi:lipoate-protein ligase A